MNAKDFYPHPDDLIEHEIARSANVYTARELVERIEEEEQKWYDLFGMLACAFSGFLVGMAVTAMIMRIW